MSAVAGREDLVRRLAEAEATVHALVSGQVDAVLDSRSGTPLLLAKAQEAVRESEARWRLIVETANEGISVVDAGAVITFVNRRFADMLGWSADELMGKSLFDIVREADAPLTRLRIEHSREGLSQELDVAYLRKDGTDLWTELKTSPILDADGRWIGTLGMTTDRTLHRQAEDALRARTADLVESETRFRQLADTIDQVFFLRDLHSSRFIYVSPAYEPLFGRTCESLRDDPRSWMEAIHPDDRERVAGEIGVEGAPTPFDVEFRIVRPDGSERSVRTRGFPVRDADGAAYRLAGIVEDITERIALAAAVRQTSKMDAIGRLASGVAHDFNNLLMVILGFAQMLADDAPADAAAREPVTEIIKAAQRAAGLTAQLLAFSRQQVLRAVPVDVNAVIEDMTRMLSRLIGEHVQIVLDLSPRLAPALADRCQLEQVLMNLIVNARDAMPEGGRVTVQTRDVQLPASSSDGDVIRAGWYVMVAVSDTGAGMSPDTLRRLFEPFFTTKGTGKGTGLGLSTTYGIVKQSQGHILVESRLGGGSTFKVYWPLAAEPAHAPAGAAEPVVAARPSETVLLVEDEPGVRLLARLILGRAGYRVLEAANGRDAARVYAANATEIALVISDVIMPGSGGPELIASLREQAPGLPALLMSGYSELSPSQSASMPGGVALLQKPFSSAELLRQVRAAIDAARPPAVRP